MQLRDQGWAFGSAHTINVKTNQSPQTHTQGLTWITVNHFLFGDTISPFPVLWCHSVLCFLSYSTSWMQLHALFCYTDLRNPQNNLEVFLVVLSLCLKKPTHNKLFEMWICGVWLKLLAVSPFRWNKKEINTEISDVPNSVSHNATLAPSFYTWLARFLPCHFSSAKAAPLFSPSFQWGKILIYLLLLMSWLFSCLLASCGVTTWKSLENYKTYSMFQHGLTQTYWLSLPY